MTIIENKRLHFAEIDSHPFLTDGENRAGNFLRRNSLLLGRPHTAIEYASMTPLASVTHVPSRYVR